MSSPYKNFRHSTVNQTGKAMLTTLRTELYAQNLEGTEVAMSLVEKQNKSGNAYNERLLVLRAQGYLGYCREFEASNKLPLARDVDFPRIKAQISLESIVEHWTEDHLLKIKFKEDGEKQSSVWMFKMSSPSLAYQWDNIIMDARAKSLQIHNKPELELVSDRQSKRPSQLIMTKTLEQSISPTKVPLSSERSGIGEPFVVPPNISQINKHAPTPLESSEINFGNPADAKKEPDNQIWVFPEFKEREEKVLTTIKSTSSIEFAQGKRAEGSSLSESVIAKKQAEAERQLNRLLKVDWAYEFLQSEETELIPLFEQFCEKLVTRLVDDLMLPVNLQKHRPRVKNIDLLDYSFEFVKLSIAFSVTTPDGLYSELAKRRLANEFNNFDYLIQHLGNEGIVRVPIVCLVEYKGTTSLVVASVRTSKTKINLAPIKQYISEASRSANIRQEVFYDIDSVLLEQIDTEYYRLLARQNNDTPLTSPLYVISEVHSFLPRDLFFAKDNEYQMTPQLVKRMKSPLDGRIFTNAQQKRGDQQYHSSQIIEIVDELVAQLESEPCPVVISRDLSHLLARRGVSQQYLGILYESCSQPQIRKMLMSEILASSLSAVIRGRLCSESLSQSVSLINKDTNPARMMESKNSELGNKLIELVRRLMAEHSLELDTIWEEIDRTAMLNHHKSVDRQELLPQYLCIALLEKCCLKIGWNAVQKDFKLGNSNLSQLFDGFSVKLRSYCLGFLDRAKEVRKAIDKSINLLELRKIIGVDLQERLPQWLSRAGLYQDVVKYHMSFDCFEQILVSREEAELFGFFELNFLLRKVQNSLEERNPQQADETGDKLYMEVERSASNVHPFVSMVLMRYATFHEKSGKLEEALLLAKNSLLTCIKYWGPAAELHIEVYHRIASLLGKLKRYKEATDYFKLIRQAVQKQSIAEADAIISEAELHMKFDKLDAMQSQLADCFDWLRQRQPLEEKRLASLATLILSVDGISRQSQKAGAFILGLQQLCVGFEEPQHLETLFGCIVGYHYAKISRNSAQVFLSLLEQLTKRESGNHNYGYAVKILKQRLAAGRFWSNLKEYITNLDNILAYISDEQLLLVWRGFKVPPADIFEDFLVVTSTILYFLGAECVQKILIRNR